MLDLKVNTFLKVVELGSYTAAANALHLTQPAVTQHIARLEEYYGCRFFQPEGRAMKLTEEGQNFLHYARMQQSNEEQLLRSLARVRRPLSLGSTLSIADYYLPELLIPLSGEPDFTIHVSVGNTETLLGKLLNGTLDAAFIEGIFDRSLFEAKVFRTPRFVPVVSAEHPLAGRRVKLPELFGFPLIAREPGSGTRAIMENYLAQHNSGTNAFAAVWEVGSFALIKQFLQNTNAISFMYEAVALREVGERKLALLDIEGYRLSHALHFVYLKNNLESRRIEEFYDLLLSGEGNR